MFRDLIFSSMRLGPKVIQRWSRPEETLRQWFLTTAPCLLSYHLNKVGRCIPTQFIVAPYYTVSTVSVRGDVPVSSGLFMSLEYFPV